MRLTASSSISKSINSGTQEDLVPISRGTEYPASRSCKLSGCEDEDENESEGENESNLRSLDGSCLPTRFMSGFNAHGRSRPVALP